MPTSDFSVSCSDLGFSTRRIGRESRENRNQITALASRPLVSAFFILAAFVPATTSAAL